MKLKGIPHLMTLDVAKAFDRSSVTINTWREKRGLPFVKLPGGARAPVRYDAAAVKRWAKENKVEVVNPDALK